MLSRIIGRPDLSNNFKKIIKDPVFNKEINLENELGEVLKYEYQTKRRSFDDLCWVESQECWACERWAYLAPIVSRSYIDDCFLGE